MYLSFMLFFVVFFQIDKFKLLHILKIFHLTAVTTLGLPCRLPMTLLKHILFEFRFPISVLNCLSDFFLFFGQSGCIRLRSDSGTIFGEITFGRERSGMIAYLVWFLSSLFIFGFEEIEVPAGIHIPFNLYKIYVFIKIEAYLCMLMRGK